MFSLQQSGEIIYHEIPFSISLRNQQDHVANLYDHVDMEGNQNLAASKASKRQRDQSTTRKLNLASTADVVEVLKNENMHRKLVRREIEKRRREDLSKLFASLDDLLPPNSVKGKRSILDCTHQAVNYIKHMQEKIETLSVKRDQIKRFEDMSVKESLLNVIPNAVYISSCDQRSFEIQINSCSIEDGFLLSEILEALLEKGHDVVNYTSKKINQRLIHSIQSEANDHTTLTDLSILQHRLTAIANDRPEFNSTK